GTPVSSGQLIERLWHGHPPASARSNLNTYLARLRRLLPDTRLRTTPSGYVLAISDSEVDAAIFRRWAAEAADASRRGQHSNAINAFEQALALWRGNPLEGIEFDSDMAAWAEPLHEQHRTVTEDLFDVRLTLGRHAEIIGGLRSWIEKHPLRERPHTQLMLALHRDGRQPEALYVYEQLRRRLIEQFGAEPTTAAQDLHSRILSSDPNLDLLTTNQIVQRIRQALLTVGLEHSPRSDPRYLSESDLN
ncbi:BTAD domain-containing putative transcriptional regulator, partial [Planotetraspora sp. GP83]|uniref:AfsR/SARP family transcriptional regulator n=1 Tax=Planotetraspora sp. GP83 TaxID=3156264 RepID=UPI00351780ED